jgi:2'-5' RNA ligase
MKTCEEIVTYWLCPVEPERSQFARLISDLAARFDAPLFEPHVTIYVTSAGQKEPAAILEKVVRYCRPYRLHVRGVDYSDKFTKTLFVQFGPNAELTRLSDELRRASASPSDYQLNPHLSLIYKDMPAETKRQLAASIALPFAEVTFDKIKAVLSPAEIKSRDEVEAWRVITERQLIP